jgi:hypothetical protein
LKTTFHSLVFEEEAQQNALARNEETGEKNHWICGIWKEELQGCNKKQNFWKLTSIRVLQSGSRAIYWSI